jgi:hypothetical protein
MLIAVTRRLLIRKMGGGIITEVLVMEALMSQAGLTVN